MNALLPLRRVFEILLPAQLRALRPFGARPHPCRRKHRPGGLGGGGFGAAGEEGERRIRLHRSRGQHILTNPRALDAIVRKAGVLPGDTVLEVGPGTGNLTVRLLQSARRVVAVEIDPRMVDAVRGRAAEWGLGDRLEVIHGDALKVEFPKFDLCVANIPYGISSPLVAKILFDGSAPRRCFRSATLLLQKEFARRLVAGPGDSEFNRLAMNVSLVATVELLMGVSKRDFVPTPRVDSSLVRVQPKPELTPVDLHEWWALTRVCFGQKNKTLGAIFKQRRKVEELFRRARADGSSSKLLINGVGTRGGDLGIGEIDGDHDGGVGGGCDCDCDERARDGDEEDAEEVRLFKEKMVGILEGGGFLEKRPTKLSKDDMLCLLSLFNEAGIHFH